jgi:hypothetical protein
MAEFKNPFTLDGRLKPGANVTPTKVSAVKNLIEDAMAGSFIAEAKLKEAMTSTDAIFSFAYLTQINLLPQYDRLDRQWQKIAGVRTVSDFRPAVLYSMVAEWNGPGVLGPEGPSGPPGVLPIIPEGTRYPQIYMSGEESKAGKIAKRGASTGFTFEAFINDALGFIDNLPQEMVRIALDTEEADVFGALTSQFVTGTSGLAGGALPDGSTVTANAPLSRNSIIRAKFELSQRKVNGRFVQVSGGYNLIVPVGQKMFVDYQLNNVLSQTRTGVSGVGTTQYIYSPAAADGLGDIEVIESAYVTGTNWYLLPKPGTTKRPVLERLVLRNHEAPEIRIANVTGDYVGGGNVSPFEGSFDTDSAEFRIRLIGGAVAWSPELGVYSNGTGS